MSSVFSPLVVSEREGERASERGREREGAKDFPSEGCWHQWGWLVPSPFPSPSDPTPSSPPKPSRHRGRLTVVGVLNCGHPVPPSVEPSRSSSRRRGWLSPSSRPAAVVSPPRVEYSAPSPSGPHTSEEQARRERERGCADVGESGTATERLSSVFV